MGAATLRSLGDALLSWPGVTPRHMFGADGFFVGSRLFAVVEGAGVATKLPPDSYARAIEQAGAVPFQPVPGRIFGQWVQLPMSGSLDEQVLLPWLKQGYDHVQRTPPASRRSPHRRHQPQARRHR